MRTLGGSIAVLLGALTLAGCGGNPNEAKPISKVVDPLVTVIKDFFHFTAETHPSPSTLHDVSAGLAEAIGSGQSIKKTLDEMAATDDPFGKAITSAICTGLGTYADPDAADSAPSPTTAQSWQTFLVTEVYKVILKAAYPLTKIQQKVSAVTTTANLATINPRLAYTYYQECGGPK
jgi:hypothetical protein